MSDAFHTWQELQQSIKSIENVLVEQKVALAEIDRDLGTLLKRQEDQEARLRKMEVGMAKIMAWASFVAAGGAGLSSWMFH